MSKSARLDADPYVAIVSIHGIGRHQRHENAGALLEALERAVRDGLIEGRAIIEVEAGLEPSRLVGSDSYVPFLRFRHARRRLRGRVLPGAPCRIYEVNWSPETRGGIGWRSMATWVFATALATFHPAGRSWLKRARLRLARLHMLASASDPHVSGHMAVTLASAYRHFRGSLGSAGHNDAGGARRGRFSDLLGFTRARASTAVAADELATAAARWRVARLPAEGGSRRASLVLLGGLGLLCLTVAAVWRCLDEVTTPYAGIRLWSLLAIAAPLLALPVMLARRFLGTVVSDVRYWAAVSENDNNNDARQAILNRAAGLMRHVMADPRCRRLVVVSHSLGTAIAHDALRELGRRARAGLEGGPEGPLAKIDTLITLGSPIDKLACLFESTDGRTFREELLRDQIAGDLSEPPFLVSGRQKIRWINFWDAADPVSDPLFTPLGSASEGDRFVTASIENVMVMNTASRDPGAAHVRYLRNPVVVARIHQAVFGGSGARADLAQPGTPRSRQRSGAAQVSVLSGYVGILLVALLGGGGVITMAWLVVSMLLMLAPPILAGVGFCGTRLRDILFRATRGLGGMVTGGPGRVAGLAGRVSRAMRNRGTGGRV